MNDKRRGQVTEFTLEGLVKDYLTRCGPRGYFALVLKEGKVVVGSSAKAVRNYLTKYEGGEAIPIRRIGYPRGVSRMTEEEVREIQLGIDG